MMAKVRLGHATTLRDPDPDPAPDPDFDSDGSKLRAVHPR